VASSSFPVWSSPHRACRHVSSTWTAPRGSSRLLQSALFQPLLYGWSCSVDCSREFGLEESRWRLDVFSPWRSRPLRDEGWPALENQTPETDNGPPMDALMLETEEERERDCTHHTHTHTTWRLPISSFFYPYLTVEELPAMLDMLFLGGEGSLFLVSRLHLNSEQLLS